MNDDKLAELLFDDELGIVANYALASTLIEKGIITPDNNNRATLLKLLNTVYFDVDTVKDIANMILESIGMSNGYHNLVKGVAKDMPTLLGCTTTYYELLKKVADNIEVADEICTYLYVKYPKVS